MYFSLELLKTLDPTCIPVLPAIARTTGGALFSNNSGALFSNNSGNLSCTESTMIPVNHEASHNSIREAVTSSVTRNLQAQHPTEGNSYNSQQYIGSRSVWDA